MLIQDDIWLKLVYILFSHEICVKDYRKYIESMFSSDTFCSTINLVYYDKSSNLYSICTANILLCKLMYISFYYKTNTI